MKITIHSGYSIIPGLRLFSLDNIEIEHKKVRLNRDIKIAQQELKRNYDFLMEINVKA